MTWGGGKPHTNVGDQGQRYEVSYKDPTGERKVFGWSKNRRGVSTMIEAIVAHPSMSAPKTFDRTDKVFVMLHDVNP